MLDGRYRVDEVVGMGAMGAVYKGRHVHLKKRIALKLLHPHVDNYDELSLRFEREAVAGAHVAHPNVAAATDFGELPDGTRFLVMEFARGVTLRALLRKEDLSTDSAVRIARQIALGLDAIHKKGMIHRDLKPLNVMVQPADLSVKIIDFGVAHVNEERLSSISMVPAVLAEPGERLTAAGVIFGTIAYMAPEAALGMDAIGPSADLYSLGLMLYEMLTGKHPFDAIDPLELFAAQRDAVPPAFFERAPDRDISPVLEAITLRLLQKSPEARYPSAAAVVEALDRIVPPSASSLAPPPVPSSEPPPPDPARVEPSKPPKAIKAKSLKPAKPSKPPKASKPPKPGKPPKPNKGLKSSRPPKPPAPPAKSRSVRHSRPEPPRHRPPPLEPLPRVSVPDQIPLTQPSRARLGFAVMFMVAVAGGAILWARLSEAPRADDARAPTRAAEASPVAPDRPVAPLPPLASAPRLEATPPLEEAPVEATLDGGAEDAGESDAAPLATPEEISVLRADITRNVTAKLWGAAAEGLARLAAIDPAAFEEPAIRVLARKAGIASATDAPASADALFEALGDGAGSGGPDVLLAIVEAGGTSVAAKRATQLLRRAEVQARATDAARVAFDLRDAPCNVKLDHLDRAVEHGDERALVALEITVRPCFKNPKKVDEAIDQLRLRLEGR